MKLILLGAILAIAFVVMDLIWFRFAGEFFKGQVGSIARLTESGSWDVLILPALLVYVLMAAGIIIFVLPQATSIQAALMFGAAFGLIGYGLYDLTNLATLSAWTARFALVDMAWGTLLCATVSAAGYWLSRLPYFA